MTHMPAIVTSRRQRGGVYVNGRSSVSRVPEVDVRVGVGGIELQGRARGHGGVVAASLLHQRLGGLL